MLTRSMFEIELLVATYGAKNCNFSNNQAARVVSVFLALPLGPGFSAFV